MNIKLFLDIIKQNIGSRKLVFRWKNESIEKIIKDNLNLKPAFYVTRNKSRIDDKYSFSDDILANKNDEYFLIIMPELKYNNNDLQRLRKFGYIENKDFIWLGKANTVCISKEQLTPLSKPLVYEDVRGNVISTYSPANIIFYGYNSKVIIGKNVILPSSPIKINSESKVEIMDNSYLRFAGIVLGKNSTLIVEQDTYISQMQIFINSLSYVSIGEKTSMQTGKLRTGRNQKVVIGKDCMFSWDVVFVPHDGHMIYDLKTEKCINNTIGEQRVSVALGDHVWIGGETVLMPCTNIGNGSITGYRALVKGTFPNNCVIAGVPAKIVKEDICWERKNFSKDGDFYKIPENYRKYTQKNS